VLVGFSESQENQNNTAGQITSGVWVPNEQTAQVARLYYSALDRAPDDVGLTSWSNALQSGSMTLQQIAADFMSSPEFQSNYGNLSNHAFIDLLYHNVLGRPADPAGEAYWTQALDNGSQSRVGVLLGFSESPEHIADRAPLIENSGIHLA